MISQEDLLKQLRPLHVLVSRTGHISSSGRGFIKMGAVDLTGARVLEVFEVLRPSGVTNMSGLRALCGHTIRLRLRATPDIMLRGMVLDDEAEGVILDLSFGIAVVDAVQKFDLTAQDFAPSDLAVELLFLQEAKSSAMAASFSLNARLDGARLAAESEALTDGLTGLHNRRALDSAMARLGQSQTDYAVLHIDLDMFKQVNDTLGHSFGDAVLRRVAGIMRRNTRKDDILIRAGGDEFIIVCPGLIDLARLGDLSKTLIAQISEPCVIEDNAVEISASIGIGTSHHIKDIGPERVGEIADIALYAAKRSGRGCHVIWRSELGLHLKDLDMPLIASR
jgi:diguanylate cyclase (GGDEF)-like protein